MPRRGEDARRRLQQAALELYLERGYDATTTAQIAERAGVTERTFFRHFADKREVFFGGEAALSSALVTAITKAPEDLAPLPVLLTAFSAVIPILEDNRAVAEARSPVIASTPPSRWPCWRHRSAWPHSDTPPESGGPAPPATCAHSSRSHSTTSTPSADRKPPPRVGEQSIIHVTRASKSRAGPTILGPDRPARAMPIIVPVPLEDPRLRRLLGR